jgi:hypothetical protein
VQGPLSEGVAQFRCGPRSVQHVRPVGSVRSVMERLTDVELVRGDKPPGDCGSLSPNSCDTLAIGSPLGPL